MPICLIFFHAHMPPTPCLSCLTCSCLCRSGMPRQTSAAVTPHTTQNPYKHATTQQPSRLPVTGSFLILPAHKMPPTQETAARRINREKAGKTGRPGGGNVCSARNWACLPPGKCSARPPRQPSRKWTRRAGNAKRARRAKPAIGGICVRQGGRRMLREIIAYRE